MNGYRSMIRVSCVRRAVYGLAVAILACGPRPCQAADEVVPLASSGPLTISEVSIRKTQVARRQTVEITFRMEGQWQNPFDPNDVRVDAVFTAPDGTQTTVAGFFYQEYRRTVAGERESYERAGVPCWKVRFAPAQAGEYTCVLKANDGHGQIEAPGPAFACTTAPAGHGYLRISRNNPLYFEFEDGTPFCAVAMDKALGRVFQFEQIYRRFAGAGGNFNRLFLTHGNFNIMERVAAAGRPDKGVGKLNLEYCWCVDQVLALGEELGVYHMLTLTNQTNFRRNNGGWDANVYNVKNGGILHEPGEYFTDERAQRVFENLLRYVAARWGASTSVFSWDLWNEVTAAEGYSAKTATPWHRRMARCLRAADAAQHVIHTNFGNLNGSAEIDGLPEMELISTNTYAVKDIAQISSVWTRRLLEQFQKPYMLTEYGIGHNLGSTGYGPHDPERVMVHDGLWGPLLNGSAGTGMAWDWDWLDNEHFYRYIQAAAHVVRGIPFSRRTWRPVQVQAFEWIDAARPPYYADALIEGFPGNYTFSPEALDRETFTVLPDGRLDRQDLLHARLGPRQSWQAPARSFQVDYPAAGQFVIYVPELGGSKPAPRLTVSVDGSVLLERDLLPYGPADRYDPRAYYQKYPIDVPAGHHTIRVANTGGGSITTAFELTNYVPRQGPNLEVRGLQTDDYMLLWLRQPQFNWLYRRMGRQPAEQAPGRLTLQGVPDGSWDAQWMDTVAARPVGQETVVVKSGVMVLKTPPTAQSVVVRLQRQSGQ
ncbi:MAG: DUF5060 domain-containing protein [Planctomycetes bacterium]|nr:DUF5060 domain-containing protein [Planctomycetota bacterium]